MNSNNDSKNWPLSQKTLERVEAKMSLGVAADQVQDKVRAMLLQMIELAPGRLFRDVKAFHEKFGLMDDVAKDHALPPDVREFRFKFMLEELTEYGEACGLNLFWSVEPDNSKSFDAEKAFDALIDLVYVALGTAVLHGFPFDEGWARVQAANMSKVRADSAEDPRSIRGHRCDVVKPEGWRAPTLSDLLNTDKEAG